MRFEIVTRVLPFALFMLVLAARGALDRDGHAFVDGRWLYLVQALLPMAALLAFRHQYQELRSFPGNAGALFAAAAVGALVFIAWIAPAPGWAHLDKPVATFVPVGPAGELQWPLIVSRCLGAVLVVPVMEELFWRSFLMRWIDKRKFLDLAPARTSWVGVLASSAVFALAHDLWLAGLFAGLAYALLYRRLGNLWCAVLAHATTNGLLAIWVVQGRVWDYW